MSESQSVSAGIAERYAVALFELVREAGTLEVLEADLEMLGAALKESPEFVDFISSPVITRAEKQAAIGAISKQMALSALMGNTLALMASRQRLFVLPALLKTLRTLVQKEKGEVTAEVASATALTQAQAERLAQSLKAIVGKTVKISHDVDKTLIAGLVVRLGSRMIDSSIRTKLLKLQNIMKEAG